MRFKTEGPVVAPNVLQERRKHNSFAVHKTEGPALAQNVLQERRTRKRSEEKNLQEKLLVVEKKLLIEDRIFGKYLE